MKIMILAPLAAATFFPVSGASAQNARGTQVQTAMRHFNNARIAQTATMMDAANKPQNLLAPPILANTRWELTDPSYENLPKRPYLEFTSDRVSARAGGNVINGSYEMGSGLKFGPLAMTRMMPPPAINSAEQKYVKALNGVTGFQLSNNQKTLTLTGQTPLVFRLTRGTVAPSIPIFDNRPVANQATALAGTEWELTDPAYENLPLRPFLKFTDTRLSASVGGNAIGGSYEITNSKIKFSQLYSTKMLAPPPIARAENEYLKAMEGVRELEVSPDRKMLTLRGDTTLTFTLTGGAAQLPTPELMPVKSAADLAWTQWQLTKPTYEGLNVRPFLNFTDKGIGTGVGGNAIGGDYSITKNKITFDKMISTMMMPPPPIAAAENAYKKALEGTHKFSLSKDGMMLTLRGKPNLVYRLVANTPDAFVPEDTKIINVAPQLGPAMDGDKASKYLQLEDLSRGVSWGKFTEPKIEGFDFVPGNRYQLRAQIERNPRTGERQLRVLDVISQKFMGDMALKENEQIWEVAPTKIDCVGVAPMKCLQVREVNGDAANGDTMGEWKTHYAPIEGFDFVEGFKYRILVRSEKVENPPADASAIKYTLVKVLEKNPVTM